VSAALAVTVAAVALACPAHMLWRMRRGRHAGCMPARVTADEVSQRQTRLAEQVERLSGGRG
jgi:hypothetical protein